MDKDQRIAYSEQLKEASQALNIDPLTGRPVNLIENVGYTSEARLVDGSWGIFATRDIEFADVVRPQRQKLILVLPAFGTRFDFWVKPSKDIQAGTTAHVAAICQAIHDLIDDPRKAADWADLHPRNQVDLVDELTVSGCLSEQYAISPLDISLKISRNARSSGYGSDDASEFRDVFDRRPFGIHIDPADAKGNHSCMPNMMNVSDRTGRVSDSAFLAWYESVPTDADNCSSGR